MTTTAQTAQTVTAVETTVSYHFIITIQSGNGGMATTDGTVSITPGAHSRMQAYTTLREQALAQYGMPSAVVVFFALEPNRL
ncbi:hypothetical protein ABT354_05570 [Streptomyces sp. NPDC000594]|uniref:hypothetical protein n=1 Tax=Streptomyces sp. NPDC000594 TaxID=3154261 RepID=UPI003320F2DC